MGPKVQRQQAEPVFSLTLTGSFILRNQIKTRDKSSSQRDNLVLVSDCIEKEKDFNLKWTFVLFRTSNILVRAITKILLYL